MWWKHSGFGRIVVVNKLEENTLEESGVKTHVGAGQMVEARVGGLSLNTVFGLRKTVLVSLVAKGMLQKPGSRGDVSLSWWLLRGPPVPDTWGFDYSISAPANEHSKLEGRIGIPTPNGQRTIIRFTFHYDLDEARNAWYAVTTDRFDWRNEAWLPGSTERLSDRPAVRAS